MPIEQFDLVKTKKCKCGNDKCTNCFFVVSCQSDQGFAIMPISKNNCNYYNNKLYKKIRNFLKKPHIWENEKDIKAYYGYYDVCNGWKEEDLQLITKDIRRE